jgi:PleD family two-component response regulator
VKRQNTIESIKVDFPAKLRPVLNKLNSPERNVIGDVRNPKILKLQPAEKESEELQEIPMSRRCTCHATVLVVEDNQYNVMPVEMILKHNYGIDIDVATDGKSSVQMIKKNFTKKCCGIRYRMVFMDLLMPVM